MAVQHYTVEDFEQFAALPENADRLYEFIDGEVVEVPSNPYSSEIASTISFFIKLYLREKRIAGHVTGEGGGYKGSGERYAPDVAYITKERQPELVREGYNPNPPNLAVEVLSPTDTDKRTRKKVANYLAAGTLLWVVDPHDKVIEVYVPGQFVKTLTIEDTLDGGNVLSGFSVSIRDIFAES